MTGSRRFSSLLMGLLLAWGNADAAGLGRLSVQSALGQPFRGEIELLSVSRDELPGITARLASSEAFRQARIERTPSLSALSFKVDQRPNGQPIVLVTSSTQVSEAFLDLLIELNWSSGRIIREYTVLLDPPAGGGGEPEPPRIAAPEAGRAAAPAPALVQVETPPPVAEPARPIPEKAKPVAPPSKPAPVEPKRYGPVKAGENLHGIALKVKERDITVEQMIVGLFQGNQGAFAGSNMNRLRQGQTLAVPDPDTVRAIAPKQAARTITGHADAWHAYRSKVASVATDIADATDKASRGKVVAKGTDKVVPVPTMPRDVLKLSKGEPVGGKGDAKAASQMAQEELAAKNRALTESHQRVSQLERTVSDMQKLLALKSQGGASPEPAKVAPPAPSPVTTPAASAAPPSVTPPAAQAPKPVKPVAPPSVAAPVTPPPDNGGWFSTFIGNPLYIGGLLAALLLSGLLWLMMVGSRRKQSLNKFEDNIVTGGGEFKANSVFGNAPQAAGPATQGSMLLTDFSRLGLGAIDTHEVDPIAEAEVYMAYGRDAQAEEILREAYSKDPNRRELALKLLEIYAARKDRMAFETTASELYASLGGEGTPEWQHAAEMGRSIDPENPLYRMGTTDSRTASGFGMAAAKSSSFDASADFGLGDFGSSFTPESVAQEEPDLDATWNRKPGFSHDTPPSQSAAEPEADLSTTGLDFDFASPSTFATASGQPLDQDNSPATPVLEEAKPAQDFDFGLDFNLPEGDVSPQATPHESFEEAAAAEFHLDLDAGVELGEPEVERTAPSLDLSGIDLDLTQPDTMGLGFEPGADQDMDFTVPSPVPMEAKAEPAPEPLASPPDFALDFQPAPSDESVSMSLATPDFRLDEAKTPDLQSIEAEPASAAEEIDPSLHEEVETKLDLARAYLEMGDKEGAREILEEVLSEGDSGQKANAEKLLAEAG